MPEVIFNGPEGRLEGRYQAGKTPDAPLALILHPHPQMPNGNMNNRVSYTLFQTFAALGFSVLRFNFRGVGRSQGVYDAGVGELSDAAAALDWLQMLNKDAKTCWIAGYSFGAWIGMQLLMRRPEISGFISVAPPANSKDFMFLAPCPSSGLIIHGGADDFGINDFLFLLGAKRQGIRHQVVNETRITLRKAVHGSKCRRINDRRSGSCQLDLVQDVF